MKSDFQIITTPKCDTPGTSTLLSFDGKRYMFGHVGEGTQRAIVDSGLKVTKLTDMFLTGPVDGRSTGGLVGMILTMSDIVSSRREQQELVKEKSEAKKRQSVGSQASVSSTTAAAKTAEPSFSVYGGKNLMSVIAASRTFVFRNDASIPINEISLGKLSEPIFEDGNIEVYAIECTPSSSSRPTSSRKRSFDNLEEDAGTIDDEAVLKKIIGDMFSTRQGILEVKEDDSDYEDALAARLERDAEVIRWKSESNTDGTGKEPKARTKSSPKIPNPEKRARISYPTSEGTGSRTISFPANRPLRRPWPATKVEKLPETSPSKSSLSYMVQLRPVRGKFLPDKAKALGVKPGPDFSTLIGGGSVTTTSGNIVTRSDCVEPDIIYPGVAIIDIPDSTYVNGTLKEISKWMRRQERQIGLWTWILGNDVEIQGSIQEFVGSIKGQHTVSSGSSCPDDIAFRGAAAQITRLNALSSDNFPLPRHSNNIGATGKALSVLDKAALPSLRPAVPLLNFQISPKQDFDEPSGLAAFSFEEVKEDVKSLGEGKYLELVGKAIRDVEMMERDQVNKAQLPGEDVEIWTLGTGSALPSKYRNVSSVFVRVPQVGGLLLDCGENSLGQLRRCTEDIDALLRDLKCIYISHLHADHHLGTASVLKRWVQAVAETPEAKIYVLAPAKFKLWLEEYSNVEYIGLDRIKFIPAEYFIFARKGREFLPPMEDTVQGLYAALSLEKADTAYADHCQGSFTVAFTFKDPAGFKIAYSGDTRPTETFVEIGKGATVLIHEATFDDELGSEALHKKHSTTGEAIKAGLDMNARSLILTHFSQRYPKLPVIEVDGRIESSSGEKATVVDPIMENKFHHPATAAAAASVTDGAGVLELEMKVDTSGAEQFEGSHIVLDPKETAMKIGFAFDLLRIKVGQIGRLQKYIPALRELFKDETEKETDTPEQQLENTNSNSKAGENQKKSKRQSRKDARVQATKERKAEAKLETSQVN